MSQTTTVQKMVTKENGDKQAFEISKLRARIENLTADLATQYMGIDGCVDKIVKYAHNGKYYTSLYINCLL